MNKPLAVIVEDDIEIKTIFELALQTEFEIAAFQEGSAALNHLQHLSPALVILDLNMPDMSGVDVLKAIKNDERLKSIPVILATADAALAATLENAADLVLIKPISPVQLRSLARRIGLLNS
ncbi:MAG: hypothetical protein DPW18_08755 [Chloroflexi bacterium]|nr:hypothetical protein [Chloroflexota bacterium]MDL1941432.1 response regulator [Chloroflexi bacterium CFX2]